MGYYADLIKEKRNAGETTTWEGLVKYMRKKGMSDEAIKKELKRAGIDSSRIEKLVSENSKEEKDNDKEITQDGYRIIVKRAGNGYALRVLDKRGHIVYERDYSPSESMALELGKREARKDLMRKEWDELHPNEK